MVVVFLHVGLDGIGIATYKEVYEFSDEAADSTDAAKLEILTFNYLYVGLPKLDAIKYLESGSELGVALSAKMKIPPARRPWFKAEALQRLAASSQTPLVKEMLSRFVEVYVSLDEPDEQDEFERLTAKEQYEEARIMGTTFLDKGMEKGMARMLTQMLERRFGRLSGEQQKRLESMTNEQRDEVVDKFLAAQTLDELGLGDAEDHPH